MFWQIVQPAEPFSPLFCKTTHWNAEWFLFLVFLNLEIKSTSLWFKHIDYMFFLLYAKPSNIWRLLIALANCWIKLARFSLHSSCYMLGTLTNVQYFFRVSCQCDIQLRILPGWYHYIWYTRSSLALYARWDRYIYLYIVYSIYMLKYWSNFRCNISVNWGFFCN